MKHRPAELTVLIPAYRSADFIAATLRSVQEQTFTDFVVEAAIEPVEAEAVLAACEPFADDSRFRFRVNPALMGWPGNIRWLLLQVRTPYFVVLPHDDGWHPHYLETLLGALRPRPDASVAYADVLLFGAMSGWRHTALPDAPLPERLLAYYLDGAQAAPWRGVTRSTVLDVGFPSNPAAGFAVDVPWAIHLINSGVALYTQRPMYLKRIHDDESVSASWRLHLPQVELVAALEAHRRQLLAGIPADGLTSSERTHLMLAAEQAALRRRVSFGRDTVLSEEEQGRADDVIAACRSDGSAVARSILARVLMQLSRLVLRRGEVGQAERLLLDAVAADADFAEGLILLARVHLRQGRPMDALPLAARAAELRPMEAGLHEIEAGLYRELGSRFEPANPGG